MTKNEKCSKAQKGRILIHKGKIEKRIFKEELDKYIKEGWVKGFSQEHKNNTAKANAGKLKGTKHKNPRSEESRKKISESLKKYFKEHPENKDIGWQKWWQTHTQAWNKGLTKETSEGVAKSAKSKEGHLVSKEHREKLSNLFKGKKWDPKTLQIRLSKVYLTKKKNNSFNISKEEENLYKWLSEQNKTKTIYRQYKDLKRYPYYCDFYIVEDDLFIELNYHWTHGEKPYDPNDLECQKQLAQWQEKAKTSQFYKQAIETWTIRDVEKRKCAIKNHLNYKVLYKSDLKNLK